MKDSATLAAPESGVAGQEGGDPIRRRYESTNAWGMLSSIDLHDCTPETIRSADRIKQFVVELCEKIDMKRFGDCVVVDFGDDPKVAGFSMTQLIETSLIAAHFANLTNTVYLDVFSCKYYDPAVVAAFSAQFFGAKDYKVTHLLRK